MAKKYQHHKLPSCLGYPKHEGKDEENLTHFFRHYRRFITQAENLVIEANYDEAMLMTGPYPLYLKNRIQSGLGHSSNVETASALVSSLSPLIKRIWLCHLSEENNHPELCRKTIQEALDSVGCTAELCVLKRRIPTGFFDL